MHVPANQPVTGRLVPGVVLAALLGLAGAPATLSAVTADEPAGAAVASVGPAGPAPSPFVQLARLQHRLTDTVARDLRRVRRGEAGAVTAVFLVSLGYGVLHAIGPGHGKAVVAALFLGRDAHVARGIAVGFLVSFLQVVTSIVAVLVLAFLLRHSSLAVAAEAVWVEVISYALVALLGLAMTVAAIRGRPGHRHGPGALAPGRTVPSLVAAAGLTPCPSSIIVLLFALANGVLRVGVEACLVMAAGMGVTVSSIGLATIMARRGALGLLQARPQAVRWVSLSLAVVGSVTLTAVGGILCVGAWARLP